jgi:hypothetical protein
MKMRQRILFGLLGAFGALFVSAAQAATVVALGRATPSARKCLGARLTQLSLKDFYAPRA